MEWKGDRIIRIVKVYSWKLQSYFLRIESDII